MCFQPTSTGLWWRRTARSFRAVLARPDAAILDICCGTGDLTMALLKLRPRGSRPILAADFARAMLSRGAAEIRRAASFADPGRSQAGSERHTPCRSRPTRCICRFRAESLDLIVTAFGFRNLANYDAGLREFHRVLEAGRPVGDSGVQRARRLHRQSVCRVLSPRVAGYRAHDLRQGWPLQLPAKLRSAIFLRPAKMLAMMRSAGYVDCAWQPYTFGIAGLYTAVRPPVV